MIEVEWYNDLVLCFDDDMEYINVSHINKQEHPDLPRVFRVENSTPKIKGTDSFYRAEDVIKTIVRFSPFLLKISSDILYSIKRNQYGIEQCSRKLKILEQEKRFQKRRFNSSDFRFNSFEQEQEDVVHTYIAINSQNIIKIGKSKNITERLMALRCAEPSYKILCFLNKDIERVLHNTYANFRIKNSELFTLTREQIQNLISENNFSPYTNNEIRTY